MYKEIKKILNKFDYPDQYEFPNDFDYEKQMLKVKQIKPLIESILNEEVLIDKNVQDASFFTELYSYEEIEDSDDRNSYICKLGIRFSTFGNMVSLYSSYKERNFDKIIDVLHEYNYVYIPLEYLDKLYDGNINFLKKDNATWFTRYFDYQ